MKKAVVLYFLAPMKRPKPAICKLVCQLPAVKAHHKFLKRFTHKVLRESLESPFISLYIVRKMGNRHTYLLKHGHTSEYIR